MRFDRRTLICASLAWGALLIGSHVEAQAPQGAAEMQRPMSPTAVRMKAEEDSYLLTLRRQEAADLRDENERLRGQVSQGLADARAKEDYWAAYVKGLSDGVSTGK